MQADRSIGVDVPRVIATNRIVPTRRVLMLEYVSTGAGRQPSPPPLRTALNYAPIITRIPTPHTDFRFIDGVKPTDLEALQQLGVNNTVALDSISAAFAQQVNGFLGMVVREMRPPTFAPSLPCRSSSMASSTPIHILAIFSSIGGLCGRSC